jgi:hypothetical protein
MRGGPESGPPGQIGAGLRADRASQRVGVDVGFRRQRGDQFIEWLAADYSFDRLEAFQVVSQAGSARVANIVDPNYTVVAKFPKSLVPR